jgi:hypothetical protein
MDDILIFTKSHSKTAHETLTNIVMEQMKTAGLKLNRGKKRLWCHTDKVSGSHFNNEGLEIVYTKIEAIKKPKEPENKQQLVRML